MKAVSKGTYGVTAVAHDGHFCRSLLEYEFCNLLSKYGIEHDSEPLYNDGSRRRADYRIGKYFVEIAGMMGDPGYRAKMEAKYLSAKDKQIKLAILLPVDVKRITRLQDFSASELEKYLERHLDRDNLFS